MDDWGESWDLPEYPKLPKLFTSAKTAKKRKHKEYIVTDELLEQPVKLPKLQSGGSRRTKLSHRHSMHTGLHTRQPPPSMATTCLQLLSGQQEDLAG